MTYQLLPISEVDTASLDASGQQRYSDTAKLADGGAVITWTEFSYADDTSYSVVAQRYDAEGNMVGDNVVVFWGGSSADVYSVQPMIAGLESGGYAISFKDVGSGGMYIATFNVLGQQISNQVVHLPQALVMPNTFANVSAVSSGLRYSTITELANGGFALTWSVSYDAVEDQYDGGQAVYSAIFNARGVMTSQPVLVSPWVELSAYYASQTNDVYGSAALNNGNYVILLSTGDTTPGNDTGHREVAFQIRSANGTLVQETTQVSPTSTDAMGHSAIVTLTDGSFVVAWIDQGDTDSGLDTLWRHFSADGTALNDVQSLGRYSGFPVLSATDDGGFFISGMSDGIFDPSFSGFAARFDAEGHLIGDIQETYARNEDGVSYIRTPVEFVTLGSGTILATWNGVTADGDDVLIRRYMAERIGTDANDIMTAALAGTAFFAGDGNDSVTGSSDADFLDGGDGNDALYGGDGNDSFALGGGNDTIDGGNGADTVQIDFLSTSVKVSGTQNAFTIITPDGTKTLTNVESVQFTDVTLAAADVLSLGAGIIFGTSGADTLVGTSDDDSILGYGGNDLISGGAGDDDIAGGSGTDTMRGGDGDDTLMVLVGDTIYVNADQHNTTAAPLALPKEWSRAAFADVEAATARPHLSLQITGSGDSFEAFSFQVVAGQTWVFDVDGASFDSYLQLYDSTGSRIESADDSAITLGAGGSTSTQDAYLSYTFIESGTFTIGLRSYFNTALTSADNATLNISVQGPGIADLITQANARLEGDAGNDTLLGGNQNDTLIGGTGHDLLIAGDGDDALYGDTLGVASIPSIANQVFRLYQATLDRDPDTAGHLNWSSRILEGQFGLSEVAASFVGSTEFKNTYGALSNTEFVSLLYQNVLDRVADSTGLANWTARLDAGMTRADAVLGFSESAEFKNATNFDANAFAAAHTAAVWSDDVFRLYHATLDRDPDLTGFTNWTDRLGTTAMNITQVAAGFVDSAEFQNTYGALDNAAFVEQLYQNVLDRPADATGLANWSARLEDGMTRAEVVLGFSQSQEFTNATNPELTSWMRSLGVDDRLDAGSGVNLLSGGRFSDTFTFDTSQIDGATQSTNTVLDLEAWDEVHLNNFGYDDAAEARAHMTQVGADVSFVDQGVTITFVNTQLDHIVDDMIFVM